MRQPVQTTHSVWADLDPEDALVKGRPTDLRANRILAVDQAVENEISNAIYAYTSQKEIIRELVAAREERKTENGWFVEVYISFDCRPKIDFSPYKRWVERMI